jgi:CubicO group peptidase (beta-lactamase class C family)
MVETSVTILKNDVELIPLRGLERRKIAALSFGDTVTTVFQEQLLKYMPLDHFSVPKKIPEKLADSICKLMHPYDILILGVHGINSSIADSFGITRQMVTLMDTLIKTNRTLLTLFGTPYSLTRIPDLNKPEAIVVAYQDNATTESVAAEIIFGGLGATGKLPVSVARFPYKTGIETEKTRLSFCRPEELGIPSRALMAVDSLANRGIDLRAYPGCQILFAKDGKVFYEKSFGHPRYEDTVKVTPNHIYDLASVTKVAATTLAIMKLFDDGKINPEDSLVTYLPGLKGSNKATLRIRDVMTHQAGLQDWIPFYKATLKNSSPDPAVYRHVLSPEFPDRVAENLYIRKDYTDTIFKKIIDSPLRPGHEYKYSDLGFYLLYKIVEHISGKSFEMYLEDNFYKPLGLSTMGFKPRKRFDLSQIVPTEYDTEFRGQLVWGDVHDPGAAMLGGISGHAGLFSDATDLAVILQMILQEGSYGGKQYLSPSTIREFTRIQFPEKGNRRGLGFDKPLLHYTPNGPSCDSTSPRSFGHSGFTGTYLWADPDNKLLFVFLSNRVYPSASNQRLSEMNLRTQIHQVMYDILKKYHIK